MLRVELKLDAYTFTTFEVQNFTTTSALRRLAMAMKF